MSEPGAYAQPIALTQIAMDRFQEALEAITVIEAKLDPEGGEEGGVGIWQALNAADGATEGAVGAAAAAFNATPGQGMLNTLANLANEVNNAVFDTRTMILQANGRAQEGKQACMAAIAACESAIAHMMSLGE